MRDPKQTPDDRSRAYDAIFGAADRDQAVERVALDLARVRAEEREACAEAMRQLRVVLTLPEAGRYLAPGDRGREHVFVVDLSAAIRARGES